MPSVHGNGGKCYAGRYHSGHAVYFYDNLPDGRLYRGKFWFSRRYYNHPLGGATETATGSFNNGAKEGCLVLAKVDTFMNNKKCVKQCERVQQSTAMSSN